MPVKPAAPLSPLVAVTIQLPAEMIADVERRRGSLTRSEFCSLAAAIQILRRTSVFAAPLADYLPPPAQVPE